MPFVNPALPVLGMWVPFMRPGVTVEVRDSWKVPSRSIANKTLMR